MLSLSFTVPLTILSFIALISNVILLFVIILCKQISPSNILLFHLAVIETLLCIIFLILAVPLLTRTDDSTPAHTICNLSAFFTTLLHPIALWTVCGLNCDRYYAISAPLHYNAIVNSKKVVYGLACGWLVAIVSVIPPFFNVAPYHLHKDIGICLPDFATPNTFWYAIVFSVCTFIIPGSLIILSNIKVFMIARYHRHRIAAAIFEVTLSAQVTITHQRNPFPLPFEAIPQKLRARSPITSVFQIIASFILLYCPYYLIIFWNSMIANVYNGLLPTKFQLPNVFVIVAFTLMHLTVFVNIVIYGLKSKAMRKSIQNYWRKKRTKHEINVEIQARTPSTCGSRRPSLNAININRSISNRRLSETYINLTSRNGTARQQMKRIASELLWQPMTSQIDSIPIQPMPHASSVNTLQIPSHDIEMDNGQSIDHQPYHSSIARTSRTFIARPTTCVPHSKSNLSIATSLLSRVFRFDTNSAYHQCHETSQSPRILITTAQSNDKDLKAQSTTFQMTSNQQHKWTDHVHNGIDNECDAKDNDDESDTTPFAKDLYAMVSKRCLSLDDQTNYANDLYTNDIGQPLLFSWPTTRKKYKNLTGYQLKINPLYGDRCEEPEIIL